MKYSNEIVEKVVARLSSHEVSQRELERVLKIPRKTLSRWLKRSLAGLPTRFKRSAKKVWNKTIKPILKDLKQKLCQGKSCVIVWFESRKVCLRTVQRYKREWFPKLKEKKVKSRRFERRKALSLMHTDWGTKRILNGKRCCFSFYVDDASRKLFALKAYDKMSLKNTINDFQIALKQTKGFKAVLSDNGRQYHKNFDKELKGVKHLRTRVRNPKCNGKAEAVVKKVKRFLKKFVVRDLNHANRLLSRYQREYNRTPHSSLKYETPQKVFRNKKKSGDISAVT